MKPFILSVQPKEKDLLNEENLFAKERAFARKLGLDARLLESCTPTPDDDCDEGF
ncbi:hypothetical protein [Candidatus Uabimicrobium sp. HlEnr_7]|uniref:hypothetical protein n=1 Tax=Candidatus Uabimicrobium helgolandensis TaxID=3095367 RepID=UPI003555FC4C